MLSYFEEREKKKNTSSKCTTVSHFRSTPTILDRPKNIINTISKRHTARM